jgi:hypothetical protein
MKEKNKNNKEEELKIIQPVFEEKVNQIENDIQSIKKEIRKKQKKIIFILH